MGVKKCRILSILGYEKNRRFVIFRGPFWPILTKKCSIRIYRKTGPTKSTVLGPGPPPWEFHKFYRFLAFFWILGPSIEPEKPSVKSASTPYPPEKWNLSEFIEYFIISRPNLLPTPFFKIYFMPLGFNNSLPRHGIVYSLSFGAGIVLCSKVVFLLLVRVKFASVNLPSNPNLQQPDGSPSNKGLMSGIERRLYSNSLTRRKRRRSADGAA
jgi:hypothetical protein